MNEWIEQYSYLAIFLGTFLEGETILILAGFATHRGYLNLTWVITFGFAGTLFGDQLFYFLGRWHSETLLRRNPRWSARLSQAQDLIDRYRILIILCFRFLYGLRTVTFFALGMGQVSMRLFIPLNILGALVWSVAVGSAGNLSGQGLELFLGNIRKYEIGIQFKKQKVMVDFRPTPDSCRVSTCWT